jgi:hypothetical protein
MTIEEAQRIAAIVATADNGCSNCVGALADQLKAAFPEFEWEIEPTYPQYDDETFERAPVDGSKMVRLRKP